MRTLTLELEQLGYESFAASVGQEAWDATAWGSPLPPASDVPVPSGYMPKPSRMHPSVLTPLAHPQPVEEPQGPAAVGAGA